MFLNEFVFLCYLLFFIEFMKCVKKKEERSFLEREKLLKLGFKKKKRREVFKKEILFNSVVRDCLYFYFVNYKKI